MEILGLSIALAAVLAGVIGVAARNIVGWLKTEEPFNIRHSVGSGIVAFIIGVPVIITGFQAAFTDVESIPEEAQLFVFLTQIGAIAGFDALTKGGMKAAVKGVTKKGTIEEKS